MLQIRVTTEQDCESAAIIKYKVEFCGEECKLILYSLSLTVAVLRFAFFLKQKVSRLEVVSFYLTTDTSTSFQILPPPHQQPRPRSPQQVSLKNPEPLLRQMNVQSNSTRGCSAEKTSSIMSFALAEALINNTYLSNKNV